MDRPINIILVSLNEKFNKTVAQNLADCLDMFYADCYEMFVYELINPKEVLEKCGIEYFKKREEGVVKNCSEYYNTIVSIGFDLFKSYNVYFKNSLIIYIKLPEGKQDKVPNEIEYIFRDEFLRKHSQIIVDIEQKSTKKCVEKIIKKLGDYYENC